MNFDANTVQLFCAVLGAVLAYTFGRFQHKKEYKENLIAQIFGDLLTIDLPNAYAEFIDNPQQDDNFENFESAAHVVYPLYSDRNSLYKDKKNNRYYLVIEKITCTSSDFNKTCNILSEYGNKENMPASSLTFFDEHYECIIKKHAIQTIVKI